MIKVRRGCRNIELFSSLPDNTHMGRPKNFSRAEALEKAMPIFWKRGFSDTRFRRNDGRAEMTTPLRVRVLVADAYPHMRAGISGDVNAQDDMLVVAEAQDGIEALELFRKFRPDVSLVDLRMPKLDGIEVVASITAS